MKAAFIQSNYIPWKGYFDIIHDVDLFVFCDDLQYTKGGFRNRNKIRTPQGSSWLTVPVGAAKDRLISEVHLNGLPWASEHWTSIKHYYSKTPYFRMYRDFFEYVYLEAKWDNLSRLNQFLIKSIAQDILGIDTDFRESGEYRPQGKKLDRLMDLLEKVGADTYVSGPTARCYIDENRFEEAGVQLVYKDYSDYPEYPQSFPPFDHHVTVLDLLFNCGPEAPYFIWGWREAA